MTTHTLANSSMCISLQKAYLLTSLHSLIQSLPHPIPSLLATHIHLLTHLSASPNSSAIPSFPSSTKIIKLARKYTSSVRDNAGVWLARFEAEKALAGKGSDQATWKEARRSVRGEGILDVWIWALENVAAEERVRLFEVCLSIFLPFPIPWRWRIVGE